MSDHSRFTPLEIAVLFSIGTLALFAWTSRDPLVATGTAIVLVGWLRQRMRPR